MAYYLIDYENVKNIVGGKILSKNDTIVFFYSKNASTVSFDLHMEICQSNAKKEYYLVESGGKNALDFQMSTYIGYLIAKKPSEKIFIISQDKGFDFLISFWKDRGFRSLERRINIDEKVVKSNTEKQTATQKQKGKQANQGKQKSMKEVSTSTNTKTGKSVETKEQKPTSESVVVVLQNYANNLAVSKQQIDEVDKIIKNYKTRQAINNNLMKLFRDSDKVGKVTKLIKPFLKGRK